MVDWAGTSKLRGVESMGAVIRPICEGLTRIHLRGSFRTRVNLVGWAF